MVFKRLLCVFSVLYLSGIALPAASAASIWMYKRSDADATKAAATGILTTVERKNGQYVSVKQFCGVFGCRAIYQWSKVRLVLEKPLSRKVAILSHLTQIALIDGAVRDFQEPILSVSEQGYVLPIKLAVFLAEGLELGRLREEEESKIPKTIEGETHPLNQLIIDPGHGGSDLGTGSQSLREKDIALIYAMSLKEVLSVETPDLEVKLTREDDRFVSLADRARFANNNGGGLFLSIHVNHASDFNIKGAETFILSPEATDDEAKKTALLENAGWVKNIKSKGMPSSEGLQKIFVDLEQQKFIQRSAIFAAYVQQELAHIDGGKAVKNRGVKQAFFFVLSQAAMPSVLVEMGFLSNPADRDRLMNVIFRDQFVKSMVTAIKRYRMKMI